MRSRSVTSIVFAALFVAVVFVALKRHGERARQLRVDVVLVVIDTLRADRLAPYGHPHDTAPYLTELAQRGALFERAYSSSSWTSPATASIFTSTYPSQHQVLTGYVLTARQRRGIRLNRIPEALPTLPEVLQHNGYRTFGFAANLNIGDAMGFTRGFDHFDLLLYRGASEILGATRINAAAEAIATEIICGESPWFLYLHYMDPHMPYHLREDYYDPEASRSGGRGLPRYDSEIGYVDAHLREVLTRLNVGPETLVVVTSDHGEEFFDHGDNGHRLNKLYDELLHVPLIVSWPERLAPRRISTPVSTVDLMPTILDLVGLEPTEHQTGASLVSLLEGDGSPHERTLFAERWTETSEPHEIKKAVIQGRWKYIWSQPANRRELYDRFEDPFEQHNVYEKNPEVAADLHRALRTFEESAPIYERSFADPRELDPEVVEELRSLGYVADHE